MTYTKWTLPKNEEKLRKAVAVCSSISGVCRQLGLAPKGGNIATIRYHITRLDLNTSHHTGQAWSRNLYNKPHSNNAAAAWKRYLLHKHGHKCWQCGMVEWQGVEIPLELDHKDGNNQNNEEDNLRILCCNCHALTPTFRNKKRPGAVVQLAGDTIFKKSTVRVRVPSAPPKMCADCRLPCTGTRCKKCAGIFRQQLKIAWPSETELRARLSESNYSLLGKELGVSDNAIRNHLATLDALKTRKRRARQSTTAWGTFM